MKASAVKANKRYLAKNLGVEVVTVEQEFADGRPWGWCVRRCDTGKLVHVSCKDLRSV